MNAGATSSGRGRVALPKPRAALRRSGAVSRHPQSSSSSVAVSAQQSWSPEPSGHMRPVGSELVDARCADAWAGGTAVSRNARRLAIPDGVPRASVPIRASPATRACHGQDRLVFRSGSRAVRTSMPRRGCRRMLTWQIIPAHAVVNRCYRPCAFFTLMLCDTTAAITPLIAAKIPIASVGCRGQIFSVK